MRLRFSREKLNTMKIPVSDKLLKLFGEGAELMFGSLGRKAG